MGTTSTVLRRIGLVLTALLSIGGILFGLGYAFADLPLVQALLITAAIVVPLVGLSLMAWRSPQLAPKVLTIGVGLFAVWAVIGIFVDIINGPDVSLIALVLALPVAVMGQRRATWSGVLLLALAVFPFLQVLVRALRDTAEQGPPLGALLGGSTGIVVVPLAVLGLVFLLAGGIGHEVPTTDEAPVLPPAREPQPH